MNSIKTDFTIKDLENISGIKAHTIRIWEKRYSLFEPNRSETNIRSYSHKSLQKLLNVTLLNKNGYKISKIASMSDKEIILHSREIAFQQAVDDEAINAFKMAMFQFDKVLFNTTYNSLLHKKTFREIFKEVFVPFLENIGLLWQTDTLLPAHEHFISNLIIQKIQINTEKLDYNTLDEGRVYVLFLPENEIHDIGLMYLNYELALRGIKTIYLGQSLPINNLSYFFNAEVPVNFVTNLTVQPYDDKIDEYFNEIDQILENTNHKMVAIGKKTEQICAKKFNATIELYPSVINFLKTL